MRRLIIAVAAVLVISGCATPTQMVLDTEVNRLCSIDGGIKVYETVKLPAEQFDKWGDITFYRPTKNEAALGDDYFFKEKVNYYQKGDPDAGTGEAVMARRQYQIIRKSDGKLLGESVLYGRRGGDLPGPWHPSSFSCPDSNEAGDVALLRKIFIATNQEVR